MFQDKAIKRLIKEIQEEFGISLKSTFLEIDDPTPILRRMSNTSMNWHHKKYDCWSIGKNLQQSYKYRYKIPLKTELEVSAGLWALIYEGKV